MCTGLTVISNSLTGSMHLLAFYEAAYGEDICKQRVPCSNWHAAQEWTWENQDKMQMGEASQLLA